MEDDSLSSASQTARAMYFTAPRTVEVRTIDIRPPASFQDNETQLVQSRLAAVSHGSELLFFRDEMPSRIEGETITALGNTGRYPLCYGYMNVGVTSDRRRVFAFQPHQDRFWATAEQLIELPDAVSDDDAVLLPSVETALSVVHDAAPLVGETVAVFGQGVIGLLVSEVLKRAGVVEVVSIDPLEQRRACSRKLGCMSFTPADSALTEAILDLTKGRGADIAINTSASQAALQHAINLTALHGTVVEASWYGRKPVELTLGEAFHRRRLTLKSSQVSRVDPRLGDRWSKQRRLETALRLCGELRPGKYISHRYPLEQAQQAFELLDNHPQQVLQIVLHMERKE